jgi:hypothetical protein
MKKLNTFMFTLGLLFLIYLVWRTGAITVVRQFTLFGWGLLALVLSEGAAEMLHTLGWRHCLSEPHRCLGPARLFQIRMAGYALNYLTPTATLSGEVAKAALLASNHEGPAAVSGVLIEKVCFSCAQLLFVAIGAGFILWKVHLPESLWLGLLVGGALVAGGIITFLLLQIQGKLGGFIRWLAARKLGGDALQSAARQISQLDNALRAYYRGRPRDLAVALCWHLLGFSLGIAATWLVLRQAGLGLGTAAAIWFLGMCFDLLSFAVPLNIGALEGSRMLALKATGYGAHLGLAYGVSLRLAQLFWAIYGLVSYGLLLSAPVNRAFRGRKWPWRQIVSPMSQNPQAPSLEYQRQLPFQ